MKKYAILSLMAVLALGACDDDDDPSGPAQTASVRVVNATMGGTTAGINVFRGDQSLSAGVAQGQGSACSQDLKVPAGNQTINVRLTTGTANVETISHNFVAGQRYTIVIYGTEADLRSFVIQDEATTTTGASTARRLRFVNATTSGTPADVFARSTTTGTPTGSATVSNFGSGTVGMANNSMYIEVPNSNVFFQLYNTGTGTTTGGTVRSTFDASTVTLPNSRNATVFFTNATTAFAVPNCS